MLFNLENFKIPFFAKSSERKHYLLIDVDVKFLLDEVGRLTDEISICVLKLFPFWFPENNSSFASKHLRLAKTLKFQNTFL